MQYSLEELEDTFKKHHERSKELHKESIKRFKKNYPEETMCDPFTNDFSLPLALAVLTKAIIEIQEKMNE